MSTDMCLRTAAHRREAPCEALLGQSCPETIRGHFLQNGLTKRVIITLSLSRYVVVLVQCLLEATLAIAVYACNRIILCYSIAYVPSVTDACYVYSHA